MPSSELRVTRDKDHLHLQLRHDLAPIARVAVGDTFLVETEDNFALYREMNSDDDLISDAPPLTELNPLTGPIAVTGAEPGDTLIVEIIDITVADQGHTALVAGTGVLKDYVSPPHTKIWRIVDGNAVFNDAIRFPIRPILGSIGTMPETDGRYAIYPGPYGGNLDDANSTIGSCYHLPVYVPEALLMVGDVHANQGDAEIAMGIEIDGEVTLRIVDLVKGESLPYARIETADTWVFPADAPTLGEAIQISAAFAARFLVDRLGITMEDAAHILSAVGNVRISQAAFAGYNVTVRTELPKSLDTLGRLQGYAGQADSLALSHMPGRGRTWKGRQPFAGTPDGTRSSSASSATTTWEISNSSTPRARIASSRARTSLASPETANSSTRASPGDGLGICHCINAEGEDGNFTIRDNSIHLMSHGYHTVVSALGYTTYYLRFLAGTQRVQATVDDMRYGDIMERTIHNALFGAQSPDGRRICYFSPLTGKREFQQHDTFCCNGNFRRAVAGLPQKVYYRTPDCGIALNLFTRSDKTFDVNGKSAGIRQETS